MRRIGECSRDAPLILGLGDSGGGAFFPEVKGSAVADRREDPQSLPWGFVLDPVANARAISDIQRRGLHAARQIADRVASSIDRADDDSGSGHSDRSSDQPSDAATAIGAVLKFWTDFAAQTVRAYSRQATDGTTNGSHERRRVVVDLGRDALSRALCLVVDARGRVQEGCELELYNSSTEEMGPLRLHCGALATPDGDSPPPSVAVEFEPAELDVVAAGSSRTVSVKLRAREDLTPATFRSLIQASGAPFLAVPLTVVIGTR